MKVAAVLFDIDGTLVDSNAFHVLAWQEAFAGIGADFDRTTLHAQIGKGTDMLVPSLLPELGEDEQRALGERQGAIFKDKYLAEVRPFARAHDLLAQVRQSGMDVVLASSASQDQLDHYLDLLVARDLVAATTSSADVARTKPAPDIFATALAKVPGVEAVEAIVVGDAPYDMEAARRCGIRPIAVRSGGFADVVLERAGAAALYDDVEALLFDFEASLLNGGG